MTKKELIDRIETLVAIEARRLIGVILGDGHVAERLKAVSALSMEFGIIKSDAECALLLLGDGREG
ncbi:MAG: hypothetical protein ACP59X_21145 [Solidesulfovibrio sp. DCME]|uniref:hypothetical protein n=1 Tax=Solidesulfovibrio sp. DCME TaxID=3447380 RepID=UPI003D109967